MTTTDLRDWVVREYWAGRSMEAIARQVRADLPAECRDRPLGFVQEAVYRDLMGGGVGAGLSAMVK